MLSRNFSFELEHEGVVCLCCGKVLISYHRHDYKTCGCPQSTLIDGGQTDYVRYGGMNLNLVREVRIVPVLRTKSGNPAKKKPKSYREVFGRNR